MLTLSQGLGVPQPKSARVLAPRLNPPHAQKTLQSGLKSPDGLLEAAIERQPTTISVIGRIRLTPCSMIGRVRLTPCSRFGNATRIVEHFGAFVEPTSACMTRSATARHRVVHQDQLTGLEDKILGYFAISRARARSAELRAREQVRARCGIASIDRVV